MWGKDFLHLISFPMSPFHVDMPNLSKIASLQTAVCNRFLGINSENPLTIQNLEIRTHFY